MKTVLKLIRRVLTISLLLVLLAITGAIFFKDKIKDSCIENLNLVLNTEVKVSNAEIQILETFPKITINLHNLQIKDAIEGSQDSLMVLESVLLGLDVKKLLVGKYAINSCQLKKGYIHIKIDSKGRHNYNILKPIGEEKKAQPFSLTIEDLQLDSVEVRFLDQRVQNNHLVFAHKATCALDHDKTITNLDIKGNFDCYQIGLFKKTYLKNKPFTIDANLIYDNQQNSVKFNSSKLKIENANFALDGKIIVGADKLWDLKISSPHTDIQSLISLLPHKISSKLAAYKSSGKLYFNGKITGVQSPKQSPAMNFDFGFNNASFFHPELEQKITKGKLKGSFTNGKTQSATSSVLSLKNFEGYIGDDLIKGNLVYSNFNDPHLDIDVNGKFAIESAMKFYEIPKIKNANGKIEADINFKGKIADLKDVSSAANIKTTGKFRIIDLNFNIDSVGLDLKDFNGLFYFNKHDLGISRFTGKIGKSDFEVEGLFKNFISYLLLDNEVLKVQAKFKSDFINLNEILSKSKNQEEVATAAANEKPSYYFNLSPFIAYDLDCNIKKLEIRNLAGEYAGKNLSGTLSLRDQMLHYQNISMDVANGKVKMSGVINAKDSSAISVRNSTEISAIKVKEAFYVLENFGQSFLTDKNLEGNLDAHAETLLKFNSKLELDIDYLNTFAEVSITDGALLDFKPIMEMGEFLKKKKYARYLKSQSFNNIHFSELKNSLVIRNGVVTIPTMVIQSDLAADITISGTHSFDNDMDYKINFPLVNFKREERLENNGISTDGEEKWRIFLTIKGNVDNYEIDMDENKSIKSAIKATTDKIKDTFKKDEDDYVEPLDTTGEFENVIIDEL